jgi:hypothetical protein
MDPEDIDIFALNPLTDDLADSAPEVMTDNFDIFQGDFPLESDLMSQMTLDPSAGTSGTQYEAPCASSYDTFVPSTRVPETQVPADVRHELPHREIRPRDTYNPSLIRRMFRRRGYFFFQRL